MGTSTFDVDKVIDRTIGKEGGYVNNPKDPGGETIWGITVGVARANGYTGAMRDMTRGQAMAIYKSQFWLRPGFNLVAAVSPAIAEELFDTGVNMGPGVPSLWLQEWLNGLNRGGRDYPDIKEDGAIGAKTVAALQALFKVRGVTDATTVMLRGLNGDQAVRYKNIARGRVASEDFLFGWLLNRVA